MADEFGLFFVFLHITRQGLFREILFHCSDS